MKVYMLPAMLAGVALFAAPPGPVQFESKPRAVSLGSYPQFGMRVSGAISLLKVEDGDVWYLTSSDGGDSFPERVRVNQVRHEVQAHSENNPILVERRMSELYVLWQARKAGAEEASVLRLARSMNWGESFSKPIDVDPGSTSQGFYTMSVSPSGAIFAAWLGGGHMDMGGGHMGGAMHEGSGLYIARSTDHGLTFERSVRVASNVCPCCRPSFAFSDANTVHVGWRGIFGDNLRDPAVATSTDGGKTWGPQVRIAADNWHLNGCPHSGSSLAVLGKRIYVAWHTVRENESKLYLAWSGDGGRTFSPPTPIQGGVLDPNHPYLVARKDAIGIVFQGRDPKQDQGWGKLTAYYREIDQEGRLSPLIALGHGDSSVNYPTLIYLDPDQVFVAWNESSDKGSSVWLVRGRRSVLTPVERSSNVH